MSRASAVDHEIDDKDKRPRMESNFHDRYWTSSDGLKLHFRDYPGPDDAEADDAPSPVLCLHGLTRNARDFSSLADHLSAKRRVIVPEMRGRGLSEYASDTGTYSPRTYVEDIEKLLQEEGVDRFATIGTSMGGLMTMMLARAESDRITAAVINDIGPVIDAAGLERIGGYVGQGRSFPTWIHAARALGEVHSAAFPDYDIDQWLDMAKRTLVLGQNGRIGFDYDIAIAEPFEQPGNAAPADLWSAFEALKDVPMVLVRGELTDLLSVETVREMTERKPDLKLATVPRIGHAPTLDEPEARAAIDELLAYTR